MSDLISEVDYDFSPGEDWCAELQAAAAFFKRQTAEQRSRPFSLTPASQASFNLVGPPGCGKTMFLESMRDDFVVRKRPYRYLDAQELLNGAGTYLDNYYSWCRYHYYDWLETFFLIDNFDTVADHPDIANILYPFLSRDKGAIVASRKPICDRPEIQFGRFELKTVWMGRPDGRLLVNSLHDRFYWVFLPSQERVLRYETCYRFVKFAQGNLHWFEFIVRNVIDVMGLMQAPLTDKNVNKFINRFLARADEPEFQQALRDNKFCWLKKRPASR